MAKYVLINGKMVKVEDAQQGIAPSQSGATHQLVNGKMDRIAPTKTGDFGEQWDAGAKFAADVLDTDWGLDFFQANFFKDGLDWYDFPVAGAASLADFGLNAVKGVAGTVEGITDLVGYGAAGVGDLFGADEWADNTRKKVSESFVDKVAAPAEDFLNQYSMFGGTIDAIGQGVGQVGLMLLTGGASSSGSLAAGLSQGAAKAIATGVTTGMTALSGTGSGMSEAYQGGATDGEALTYGLISGAADAATELLFGGLGKGVNAVGISTGLSSADDMLAKTLTKNIKNTLTKNLVQYGVKAGAEGLEEVLAGGLQALGKKATYMSEEDLWGIVQDENLLEQFVVGAFTSGIAQVGDVSRATKNGQDFITGLTDTEQKVFDKAYEDRIAQAESDGKKLSGREKQAIYDRVMTDMEKGRISTNSIAEVLGGEEYTAFKSAAEDFGKSDTFKAYKDTLTEEKALTEEYNDLKKKIESGEYTYEELSRFNDLVTKKNDLAKSTTKSDLKAKLDEEYKRIRGMEQQMHKNVSNMVSGTRLAESYNEMARSRQKYEADVSKYTNEKAKQTIQNIMDSGVANNTNEFHEFADWLAKISEDKDMVFSLTDAKKLKGTKHSFEGKVVNGFIDENGNVTLNMDSSQAAHTTVGHEITHILEGTDFYKSLKDAVFNYAITKEGLDAFNKRLKATEERYKGINKDPDTEVVADLIGKYLFTDYDFVNNLAKTNRKGFMKIWDEIKYLYKIATAGSKERRELEKVKHYFQKAYNENVKGKMESESATEQKNTAEGTKYALENGNKSKYNKSKKSWYSQSETEYMRWEKGSAKPGDLRSFNRFGKTRYYEKTENGCVELSRAQYNERVGIDVREDYKRAKSEIGETVDYDESAGRGLSGYNDSNRNTGSDAAVFGQAFREEFSDVSGRSVSSTDGYNRSAAVTEYDEGASDYPGAPVTFSNDYAAIRNRMKEGDAGEEVDTPVKYSVSDSEGNQLSKEQQEYFKDSKMRDADGNLKVMYHGSQNGGFTVFDPNYSDDDISLFFVDRNDVAMSYSGTSETYAPRAFKTADDLNSFFAEIGQTDYSVVENDGSYTLYDDGDEIATSENLDEIFEEFKDWAGVGYGDVNYKVYLNLKNPLVVDADDRNWNALNFKTPDETIRFEVQNVKGRWKIKDNLNGDYLEIDRAVAWHREEYAQEALDDYLKNHPREQTIVKTVLNKTRDVARYAKEQGYDGVIFNNIRDNGGFSNGDEGASTVAIAFDSNQVKSVANDKPTADPDIRYSLSEDTSGRQLSKEQKELFKNTKTVDGDGKLKVLYHGSRSEAFTEFDLYEGVWLTTDPRYAEVYAGQWHSWRDDIAPVEPREDLNGLEPEVYSDPDYRVYEMYANIKNPANIGEIDDILSDGKVRQLAQVLGMRYTELKPLADTFAEEPTYMLTRSREFIELAKEKGFDGFKATEKGRETWCAFVSEDQVKLTSNTKPTADPDIRFSLSDAVEETNDLVALHNLTQDKLLKSLELGGLPMPSIAITKASIPHDNFGEITLILGKDTIDPKANKKNVVYSADAWTPVFPQVEYETDVDVERQINRKLLDLATKVDDVFKHDIDMLRYSHEDNLNRYGGEEGLIQYAMGKYGLKAAYLENQGHHIEKVTEQVEEAKKFNPANADKYQAIMDVLGVSTASEIGKLNLKETMEQHGEALEAIYPGITQSAMRMSRFFGIVQAYIENKDSGPVYRTVTDEKAMRKAVDEALDAEGFENWVRNLFSGVVKNSGIYNNKDLFTPSGNRRSFKQTHLPVTLENIVKAMASQNNGNTKNVSGFNGIKTLRAGTAEQFKSIEAMHERKGRLQHLTQEEANKINDDLSKRLYAIMEAIDNENGNKGNSNPFIRFDSIGDNLMEISEGGKYNEADIQRVFAQYGNTISDNLAADIKQLLFDVAQMPVNIYEAKPERAVSFDEVGVFVIPRNADVKLKQELLNRGYSIAEYDPDVEGDRQKVVNQFEEYKFSLSDAGAEQEAYGDLNTPLNKFKYEEPVREDIAPAEEADVGETVDAPWFGGDTPTEYRPDLGGIIKRPDAENLFPDDLASVQGELSSLLAEKDALDDRLQEAIAAQDADAFNQIAAEYDSVMNRIAELEQETGSTDSIDSLTDADAPPEIAREYDRQADVVALTKKNVTDIAREVRDSLGLSSKQMYDVHKLITDYSNSEFPSREQLFQDIKEKLGTVTEKYKDQGTADAKKELRTSPIFVDDIIRSEIADFGDLRKRNRGKIRFNSTGVPVDVKYAELSNSYPHLFPADIINPTDQFLRIVDVANMDSTTTFEQDIDDATLWGVTNDIAEYVDDIKQLQREADANKHSREAFDSLMRDADMYAPPADDDIAPVAAPADTIATAEESVAPAVETPAAEAPAADKPIKTVKERLSAKLANFQSELAENQRLRKASWSDYDQEIARLQAEYNARKNKTTIGANDILRRIEKLKRMQGNVDADYAKRISDLEAKTAKVSEEIRTGESTTEQGAMRRELHTSIVDGIKTRFAEEGFDFDDVLKEAKDLSTFATVDNTPQRVMEKSLGYKAGQVLSDMTVNKVAQNETEGVKWLNSFTDRKNGLLAKISKQYNIKPGSKESAAAQMYAEGFYVNDRDEIIQYGDAELAKDFPNADARARIKGLAKESRIRKIYDDTLAMINQSRARNAYPEIQKLDNYFLHFRAMDDTFSRLGLPFNPNDIRAKDLPTDLNGVTADLKPGQPYFASAMHRKGKRTNFDLLGGLERYLTSAKDQIYHIDDIQTLRALRNYIADTYGQAKGLEGLDAMSEEEVQDRIEKVYNSHLSTFAKFLNEEANVIAGKTSLIDRGLEGVIGRRGITFLNTVNQQVGKNMVGFNVSSSLTNILPVVQTFAKTNKADFVKAFAQTVSNKLGSINGKSDGFAEASPVIVRRKGADSFYRTPYQKIGDAGYVLMSAVDNISTELIARTKYNELVRKGMDTEQAHIETDKWVSRMMGDRSLGQQPQLYNSKMLGLFTKFQLEVRNQLDSQFYDTIQEANVATEDIENGLARNAKKAAKITSTFVQLAVAQHLFGKAFESVAGYNPAFDIISVLIKMFGWDDDEEDEDTVLDNIEQAFQELIEDLPYTSTLTGGRIPISSALPIKELVTGKDEYGNEKSRLETLAEAAPYYLLPGGYGQYKKTKAGLDMFSDEHPIAGSYTDKGNLRFPVEDNLANRAQAAVFGQWASENARDYFDNDWAPLNEKQTQEFIDVDIPIQDYRKYREGLKGKDTAGEKVAYIAGLDLPIDKKNLLANNLLDREDPIDLADWYSYDGLEEFDYAKKYPEKHMFLEANGITVEQYNDFDEETKEAYSWAYQNPGKFTVSKVVASDLVEYRRYASDLADIRADKDEYGDSINGSAKEKKIAYINSLNLEYGQKIILFRSQYKSDDTYNYEIVEYLNGREDLSYDDIVTILEELDFAVYEDGTVRWD